MEYIYFGSNASEPYNKLSNYYKCIITYNGITYPSVEHAFQAQRVVEEERKRFSVDGNLGNVTSGFKLIFNKDAAQKKIYWMKKKNIGILAKMAIKRAEQLGLHLIEPFIWNEEKYIEILLIKYSDPEMGDLLRSTGNKTLILFDRNATESTVWGGRVDATGHLIGKNGDGVNIMKVRDIISQNVPVSVERMHSKKRSRSRSKSNSKTRSKSNSKTHSKSNSKTHSKSNSNSYKRQKLT